MKKDYELIEYKKINGLILSVINMISRSAHCHKEFEIGYILKGNLVVNIEEDQQNLTEGDFFLINPFELHTFQCDSPGAVVLFIQYNSSILQSYYPLIKQQIYAKHYPTHEMQPQDVENITSLFLLLAKQYYKTQHNHEFYCIGILNLILEELSAKVHYIEKETGTQTQQEIQKQRISRILDYVNAHYDQKLLLRDLAEQESLSLYYLSHFFKKYMNLTFQEYLNEVRFQHAEYLIEHTDKSILDISIDCGFSDIRYLNRMFAQHYGCTPNEYRQQPIADKQLVPVNPATVEKHYTVAECNELLADYHGTYMMTY